MSRELHKYGTTVVGYGVSDTEQIVDTIIRAAIEGGTGYCSSLGTLYGLDPSPAGITSTYAALLESYRQTYGHKEDAKLHIGLRVGTEKPVPPPV